MKTPMRETVPLDHELERVEWKAAACRAFQFQWAALNKVRAALLSIRDQRRLMRMMTLCLCSRYPPVEAEVN